MYLEGRKFPALVRKNIKRRYNKLASANHRRLSPELSQKLSENDRRILREDNKTARKQSVCDELLPGLIEDDAWIEKKSNAKVWHSAFGEEYNKKWQRDSFVIIGPDKNLIQGGFHGNLNICF